MIEPFINHISKFITLNSADLNLIASSVPVKSFKKGELLLKQGEISKEFYFNISGFVRLFYNQDGNEKTAYFYRPDEFISAYASFVNQVPSQFNLEATEDSQMAIISLENSVKLLTHDSKFEVLARIAMEQELINHQEIIASLLTMNPEARYLNLLNRNPEIFQKVSQIQIASYLGVQPESLSRIKKRALSKS